MVLGETLWCAPPLGILEPSKAYSDDKISIHLLKLSDKAICKHLHMISTSCLETRFFSIYWKKANIVPTHKKEIK